MLDSVDLFELAKAIEPYATLYAVGGCVRDGLLSIECFDIDVCAELSVNDVKKALLNTDFVVNDKNLRMGTVHISRGKFTVEYTTWRSDSYDISCGDHTPKEVAFTKDMTLDARRRDFRCNAVYYDILRGKIVDPLGGVEDIKNKVLTSADDPEIVFEADGLRILRLVRFYAELGFSIDEKTLSVAKQNAWRVKDIAVERIREELLKIFVADTRHKGLDTKDGHIRGLRLLDELGLVDMLLPELAELKGLEQPAKYHLYNAYEHSLKAFEISPPNLRIASLFHDLGKRRSMKIYGKMFAHDVIGEEMTRGILNRLKFSNADIYRICQLVRWHMVDINGNTSQAKLRRFIVEHVDIIDDLCDLMDVDGIASRGELTRQNRVRDEYNYLKSKGIPLRIKDLKVSGKDLVDMGVECKYRSTLLKDLLFETALNPHLNNRDVALAYVYKKYKSLARTQT